MARPFGPVLDLRETGLSAGGLFLALDRPRGDVQGTIHLGPLEESCCSVGLPVDAADAGDGAWSGEGAVAARHAAGAQLCGQVDPAVKQ